MVFTPRSEQTPEQRQVANGKKRDKYNERKVKELEQQLEIKDKENAALRSAIKESNPGAGSRKTPEGGIKKTGQQPSRREKRQANQNEGGQGDGRGGRGGRGGSSNNNNNDNNNNNNSLRCFRCGLGDHELELMGHGGAVKSFPEWCPVCRYLRVDRASAQQLEPVMENYGLVLRPVRQSLSALAQGQTLAVSPYASGPPQPPPTPAAPDAVAFAERMVDMERRMLDRASSALNDQKQQYLATINMMADRLPFLASQPPLPQQALPAPTPQQSFPAPPPQQAPSASGFNFGFRPASSPQQAPPARNTGFFFGFTPAKDPNSEQGHGDNTKGDE